MANKKIQGITIAFEGDTTPLQKALRDVDKASGKTQKELNNINRALKFDSGNTTLLAQQQEVLQDAIQNSTKRLDALKIAQSDVERMFAAGEIDASAYREFRRDIEVTENTLESYKKRMESLNAAQEGLANSTKQMQRFFDATGKSIDDFADVLGNDLVRAIKEGRATSSQLENAFNQIGQAALGTNADLDRLRTSLRTMDASGSLDSVRQDLQEIENEARQAEQSVSNLSGAFGAMGGIVAGLGVKEVLDQALETSDLDAKIDITFDIPEESKTAVREALANVKKYGIDGEEALEGLRRQWALNANATDESNAKMIEGAAAVAKSYSRLDFIELVQEVNEIASELKTTDEEALNIVNSLLKIGFPDEQVDIIAEYGGQLQRAGYEASEIQSIFAAGVKTGSWNIDNLLDGLKEGRIRASEFGLGLSEAFKENLRGVTNTVKPASDEQVAIMQEGFTKQEDALSNSVTNREKELSKSHDQQKKQLEKAISTEYDAISKNYDKQHKALEKALSAELKAFEKASNQKMKLLDTEYMAKLKIIDEEKYNKIKAIEDEINALEGLTEAENKAAQAKVDAEKRAELQKEVTRAKTNTSRKKAEEALAKFDAELRQKAILEERKDKIDSMKDEKDTINEAFDEKKEALKTEYDLKKEQLSDITDAEKEALQERIALQKEAFTEEKNVALSVLREEQTARKEAMNERLTIESEKVRESHQAELASFKAMNAEKLEIVKNPPDSAAFKAIESQLSAWGEAIASGGEKGSQAFEDMTAWLDSIEDSTLKNIIGVQLFGTKWEDQGQNIVDTILNADTALQELETTQGSVNETMNRQNDGNAMVSWAESVEKLKIALQPLLLTIAKVIDLIASIMVKFPGLSSAIVAIVTVVGILAGAFAFLAPAIAAIPAVIAVLTPVFTAISGVIATLSSVVLPALGAAFTFITGPIGIAVATIVGLIALAALVVKNWTPIKKFFIGLWEGITDAFEGAWNKIKDICSGLGDVIKKPLNWAIEMLNKFINGINNIKLPDWVPFAGGKGMSIPEIPMLAKGTNYFKGGLAIVGEQGAELVEMPTGAKVHTADKTAQMLGGTGEITINVPVMLDGKQIAIATAKYSGREQYRLNSQYQRGNA